MYGKAGPDSCPDFDHFGAGCTALQRMLVQEANGKILLLPAWPSDWDVDFKLHLEKNTVISGKVADGELADWSIEPAARKQDVVVYEPQEAAARAVIPENKLPQKIPENRYPLRIGVDQSGNNRFRGNIGRATLFRGLLKPETIRDLAAGDRSKKVASDSVINSTLDPQAGDILPTEPADFGGEISLEAWLQPEKREAGRIFDKLTGGQRDGFLVDCWPNLSLRVIIGPYQKSLAGVLKPGVWQHVAVVIGKNRLDVYLDGKKR